MCNSYVCVWHHFIWIVVYWWVSQLMYSRRVSVSVCVCMCDCAVFNLPGKWTVRCVCELNARANDKIISNRLIAGKKRKWSPCVAVEYAHSNHKSALIRSRIDFPSTWLSLIEFRIFFDSLKTYADGFGAISSSLGTHIFVFDFDWFWFAVLHKTRRIPHPECLTYFLNRKTRDTNE